MDNNRNNKGNIIQYLLIGLFSIVLSIFLLKTWNNIPKKSKNNIIIFFVFTYIIAAIIGIVFYLLAYFENK